MSHVVISRRPPPKDYMNPLHQVWGPFSEPDAAREFAQRFVKTYPDAICVVEPLLAPSGFEQH